MKKLIFALTLFLTSLLAPAMQAAKVFDYTDPQTGAEFKGSYWRCVVYQINLRPGQNDFTFIFDGYATLEKFSEGKAPIGYITVKVPAEAVARYAKEHLVNKKTLNELATMAAEEFGYFPGAEEVVDPLFKALAGVVE